MGCQYVDQAKDAERLDAQAGVITHARTELCDMTHNAVMKLTYELPRRCPEVELYASQMSNIAKVLEEDERRGTKVYRYRKLGPDHYRHATNYFELAVRDVPVMRLLTPDEQLLMNMQFQEHPTYRSLTHRSPGYEPLSFGLHHVKE